MDTPSSSECVIIKILPAKRKANENDQFIENKRINLGDKNEIPPDYDIDGYDLDELIVYSPISDIYEEEHADENNIDRLQTSEIFLQNDNCYNTSSTLPQCRECNVANPSESNKYTCRFFAFRKIEKEAGGVCRSIGFLDKHLDPTFDELDLWTVKNKNIDLSAESSNYILTFCASQFCEMAHEELNVWKSYDENEENIVAWKRSVFLVREMCDVCATSLFNYHWTCTSCGTSVCIDCYKERKDDLARWKLKTKAEKEERDNFYWYKCHNNEKHKLVLSQMVPGDALMFLSENIHKICDDNLISMQCCCRNKSVQQYEEAIHKQQANVYIQQALAKRRREKMKSSIKHTMNLMELTQLFTRVPHTWVNKGRIFKFDHLSEAEENYKLFQSQWQKGKPVMVANVTKNMRKFIWTPEYFQMRFGSQKHSVINCQNDTVITRVPMKHFWNGFNSYKTRLPVDNETKLILKLKDWPTLSDFADVMKDHFEDLAKFLPFSAYSSRDGKYNLAKYLPNHFLCPDLGPKMYSAYGQELPAKQGSTNLHLDISDAMNVCVHVSKPADAHLATNQYSSSAVMEAMKAAGCDDDDLKIFKNEGRLPGAIWYIYQATKADEMRKVLIEVAKEKGKVYTKNEDPLHDQDCFIDQTIRQRLRDKGIDGYTLIQYEGDAVFVPAGAPHQVTNLFDCIKVALDFVSPENISECFNLTSEFRKLSSRHGNREDKLQIKSILYHVIKCLVPSKREFDL